MLEPVERDLQMDVALAPQHHFLQVGIVLERQGRVFLDQLGDGRRQLDVVGALLGGDGEAEDRRRHVGPRQFGALPDDSTVPVAMPSIRASATTSPGPRSTASRVLAPVQAQHAADAHAVQASCRRSIWPLQTRTSESLPVCGA